MEKDVFIPFIHRPLSRYLNALADNGLLLHRMVEPAPPAGFLAKAEEYEARLKEAARLEYDPTKGDKSQADFGRRIYKRKACDSCHSLDGSAKTGPTWKGIYGRTEQTNAGPVTVDDNYIRESILEPNKKVVQGYTPQMPSFAGQLDDKQITALIEFMKEQK